MSSVEDICISVTSIRVRVRCRVYTCDSNLMVIYDTGSDGMILIDINDHLMRNFLC